MFSVGKRGDFFLDWAVIWKVSWGGKWTEFGLVCLGVGMESRRTAYKSGVGYLVCISPSVDTKSEWEQEKLR